MGGALRESDFVWLVGSLCRLHGLPFDAALLTEQYPCPQTLDSLRQALANLGLESQETTIGSNALKSLLPPYVAFLKPNARHTTEPESSTVAPALVTSVLIVQADAERILYFVPGAETPETLRRQEFLERFEPRVLRVERIPAANHELADPADSLAGRPAFGFKWFIPELMKHKRIWRDVLLASLAINSWAWDCPSSRK